MPAPSLPGAAGRISFRGSAMHLLVTRPEPDATATARLLEALGHTVIVEPLLGIVLSEPPAALPAPAALIVTSGNGVRAMTQWPQAAGWRGVPVFAVGEATAEHAREAGFRYVSAGRTDSAGLAAMVAAALPADCGPVIYATARDRGGKVAERLKAAGYHLRVVEAYRAERAEKLSPALLAALAAGTIDGALFYSRRTAVSFRELTAGRPVRLAHVYALSEQIAEPLHGLGTTLQVAPVPTEAHLLALIPPG